MAGLPGAMRATAAAAAFLAAAGGMRVPASQEQFDADGHATIPPELRVNLLITRHALSCANIVNSNAEGTFRSRQHALMLDPAISQCGVVRAQRAAESVADFLQNRTVDFVLSSSLTRAMETAMNQYPGHTITPVPYLSEHSMGLDNIPADVDDQIASLSSRYPDVHGRIDFEWMRHHVYGEATFRYNTPSFDHFLNFLVQDFLPRATFEGQEINIAVVTHSHFMKDEEPIASHCRDLWDADTGKPRNNQVVEMSYDVSRAEVQEGVAAFPRREATLVEVDGRYCRDVFLAFPRVPPPQLCMADIGEQCQAEMHQLSFRPRITCKDHEIARRQAHIDAATAAVQAELDHNRNDTNLVVEEHRTSRAMAQEAYAASLQAEIDELAAVPCCVA